MKFEDLYRESLSFWPDTIDISDGKHIGSGTLFKHLSTYWDNAEKIAELKGDWFGLMTWVIFQHLHSMAVKGKMTGQLLIHPDRLDEAEMKLALIEALKGEDYLQMLEELS